MKKVINISTWFFGIISLLSVIGWLYSIRMDFRNEYFNDERWANTAFDFGIVAIISLIIYSALRAYKN